MAISARRRPGPSEAQHDLTKTIDMHIRAERLRQLKLKTQELEHATVSRGFHEQCLEEVADVLIKAFEELPSAVATQIVGCTPAEAEDLLRDRIDDIRRQAANEAASQKARTNGEAKKRRVGRPLKDDQG